MENVTMHISTFWFFETNRFFENPKSPFNTVFLYITYSKSPFFTVLGSLPPPHGLCACLRRFGDLRKNTSLEFGSMYLVDLVNFYRFLVPPTTPWSMCLPAALRRPQKKHAPGLWEHVSCGFYRCLSISGSPKPLLRSLGYKTANPPQLRPTAPVHPPPPPCPRGGVYYPIQSTWMIKWCCADGAQMVCRWYPGPGPDIMHLWHLVPGTMHTDGMQNSHHSYQEAPHENQSKLMRLVSFPPGTKMLKWWNRHSWFNSQPGCVSHKNGHIRYISPGTFCGIDLLYWNID